MSEPNEPVCAVPNDQELPVLELPDEAAWRGWLTQHHASSRGVWVMLAKQGRGAGLLGYEQVVDAALCWGWVGGQKRKHDDRAWLLKLTPRGSRSAWSKSSRSRALALIARGDMQAPGLAEVERAQRDGRWDAAYASREVKLPADFAAALAEQPRAAEFFAKLNAANRHAILWRLRSAKREDTRRKRILLSVAMLARRESA